MSHRVWIQKGMNTRECGSLRGHLCRLAPTSRYIPLYLLTPLTPAKPFISPTFLNSIPLNYSKISNHFFFSKQHAWNQTYHLLLKLVFLPDIFVTGTLILPITQAPRPYLITCFLSCSLLFSPLLQQVNSALVYSFPFHSHSHVAFSLPFNWTIAVVS